MTHTKKTLIEGIEGRIATLKSQNVQLGEMFLRNINSGTRNSSNAVNLIQSEEIIRELGRVLEEVQKLS